MPRAIGGAGISPATRSDDPQMSVIDAEIVLCTRSAEVTLTAYCDISGAERGGTTLVNGTQFGGRRTFVSACTLLPGPDQERR